MVFQNYALYPHLSVRANLGFGLKLRKTSKDEIAKRVDEVAKILGLEEMLERKPGELSGGQRQRVAMGRAIVREPQAFLMDEPLSQPRRQAARLDARAAQPPARAPRRDDGLRHPRPGRGDDARPARRRHARRRAAAVRHARDAVRAPREPVRGRVHRLAGDEPRRGDASRTARRASAPAACRSRPARRCAARSCSASARTTSSSAAPASPAACRSSSGSGPRPTWSSASTRRGCARARSRRPIDAAPDDDVLLAEDDRASFTVVTEARTPVAVGDTVELGRRPGPPARLRRRDRRGARERCHPRLAGPRVVHQPTQLILAPSPGSAASCRAGCRRSSSCTACGPRAPGWSGTRAGRRCAGVAADRVAVVLDRATLVGDDRDRVALVGGDEDVVVVVEHDPVRAVEVRVLDQIASRHSVLAVNVVSQPVRLRTRPRWSSRTRHARSDAVAWRRRRF